MTTTETRHQPTPADEETSSGSVSRAGISFVLSEDGEKLIARAETCCPPAPIDMDQVTQMLVSEGLADLFIFAEAIDSVVKHCSTGTGFTIIIGERRNATFSITVAPDLMSAHLTITPACGGKPVTAEQIYSSLQGHGVTFGILDDTIQSAVAKGCTRNKLIAEGSAPTEGDDAQFISLLREVKNSRLACDDDDVVDYRSFGNIVTVKKGDPVMRRLPPTDGKPGTNILGAPVPASKGLNIEFSDQSGGTEVHGNDPDLLIASISGQPFLLPNGVIVEPVVTIKDVDLSTGNLDIEGSLTITGDVKPGMHVKATADILIQGMVEAGHVEAGGDIEIRGAIIGQGDPRNIEERNCSTANLSAQGSVKAQFAENAIISAGADIVIRDFVMNSDLCAGRSILVGEQGSSKGRIISSLCRAAKTIEAVTIGSRSGAGTLLEVGMDPVTHEKFLTTKQMLHLKEREFEEISKALEYFHANPSRISPDTLREKEERLPGLRAEIQELAGQLRRLKKRFDLLDSASVKAERQVFCGVKIKIGEKTMLVENDMNGTTFTSGENGITYC